MECYKIYVRQESLFDEPRSEVLQNCRAYRFRQIANFTDINLVNEKLMCPFA